MTQLLRSLRILAPVAVVWLAGTAGIVGIVHANPEGAAPPPPAGADAAQTEVSDEQLRQFVEAASEVQSVQEEYAAEIQSTQEAEEAQSLRQEAQEKMVQAVEDSGLTVSEYNLIAQRLQQDPSLANRLNDIHSD